MACRAEALGEGWLREWESHPPEEVYEASLCTLVEFPAAKVCFDEPNLAMRAASPALHFSALAPLFGQKLVVSVGNAPRWSCLQGKCIACLPRPRKVFL